MPRDPSHHAATGWRPVLAPYIAPLILVCVASLQLFLAYRANLSPWKGGGFGMFSTIARPDTRLVRGYLLTHDNRQIPMWLPPGVDRQIQKVRCLPASFQVERLARELEARPWVVGHVTPFVVRYEGYRPCYEAEHPDPSPGAGPPPARPVLLAEPSGKIRVAKPADTAQERARPGTSPGVAIEVWQLRFNGRAHLLQLELLTALNAEPHE